MIILGLGNTLLKDDGVGIYVVRELKKRITFPKVDIVEASLAGLNLLDILQEYNKAIIVDAIDLGKENAGKLKRFNLDDFKPTQRLGVLHEIDLPTALNLGKRLGLHLPLEVVIYGIGVSDCYTFDEKCSPIVSESIPAIVDVLYDDVCKLVEV